MNFLANPWVLVGAGVAWLASLVGVGMWQYDAGQDDERVEWQEYQSEEQRRHAAKLAELTAINIENEKARREAQAAADAQHIQELQSAQDNHNRVISSLRTGELRLRDRYATALAACRAAEGTAPGAVSDGDEGSGTELSNEASRFLLDLTHEADEVVIQLTACQVELRQCVAE